MNTLSIDSYTIDITSEFESYNAIRIKYKKIADDVKEQIYYNFEEIFPNLNEFHFKANDKANEYLFSTIDTAINDLVSKNITDIDDELFITNYLSPYSTWVNDFSKIDDQYLEIVLNDEQLDEYRTLRRQNSGGVMGGGFGVEGMARGFAFATAANVAIGAIHSIFNAGAKAVSSVETSIKKNRILNSPQTKKHISKSFFNLVFQVHYALVDALNENSKNTYELISEDNNKKANSIINNIKKNRISKDNIKDNLITVFRLNPYTDEAYRIWFDEYRDHEKSLLKFATFFGMDSSLLDYQQKLLLEYKNSLDFSSPNKCLESLKKLEEYAESNGIFLSEKEKKSIFHSAELLKENEKKQEKKAKKKPVTLQKVIDTIAIFSIIFGPIPNFLILPKNHLLSDLARYNILLYVTIIILILIANDYKLLLGLTFFGLIVFIIRYILSRIAVRLFGFTYNEKFGGIKLVFFKSNSKNTKKTSIASIVGMVLIILVAFLLLQAQIK